MSHSHRLIILYCLLFSSGAHALDFFVDALYWRATEVVDWVLIDDLVTPNLNITYGTVDFHYDPGFRIGVGSEGAWDNKFYYTHFYTKTNSSASGNLVSTFLGGKFATSDFYQTGQVNFTINFNMLDWDIGKSFYVSEDLMLRPILGLRGGWIHQRVVTNFQGPILATETVENNFNGVGPKIGIESDVIFYRNNGYKLSLVTDFSTSYLWGSWNISDVLYDTTPATINVNVGSRNFGAFTAQVLIGLGLNYRRFSMQFGYEISDWFDQYQVLDDGTGAHNNDLILQGLTLCLSYRF